MKIGEEGDTRKFRSLRKSDHYEAKAAFDADKVTQWPRCDCCGEQITEGRNYNGKCFRCHNEPL